MNRVAVEQGVLGENNRIAAELRTAFAAAGTLALNFIGSPDSGRTMFIEKTLELLPAHTRAAVLTGDAQTSEDARRLMRYGYPVHQVNTGGAGPLRASMVEEPIGNWLSRGLKLLLIENAGNLGYSAHYDLGEDDRVVVFSVTEGDDQPLKYPGIFGQAALMIVNKIDLLPRVPFDLEKARENARTLNPGIEILETSCTTGAGLNQWMQWLDAKVTKKATASLAAATQ